MFLYVCLLPVGWSPWPAQIQWADLVFVGLGATMLAARAHRRRFTLHALDLLVLLYLAASLASFRRSPDVARSGVELAKQAYLVLVYGVFSALAGERGLAAAILSWFAGMAAVLAGLGLLALATYAAGLPWFSPLLTVGVLPGVGDAVRITGPLLSPGFFCNYLTMALPVLIAQVLSRHRGTARAWLRLLIVAAAAAGTMTYSIVGFLWAGLAGVWRAWGATRGARLLRAAAACGCVALLLAGNLLVAVSIRELRWAVDANPGIPAERSEYSFQPEGAGARRLTLGVSYNPISYLLLKQVAVRALMREPLTGTGLGSFHADTERAYGLGALQAHYRRSDPHAELLGRLAETGLLGGLTLLLLWWGIAWCGWQLVRATPASVWVPRAILAGCLGILVNSLNADVMNFRFLWVGLGLLRGHLRMPG